MLQNVEIFHGLPAEELELLVAAGNPCVFAVDELLMSQGEPADFIHVLISGAVRVERSHPQLTSPVELATLGAGDVVGEIAVLDGGIRTATVVATERTETLRLSAEQLAETVLRHPGAARALLSVVSRRLRSADELAVEIRRRKGEAR